jgi:hypothetical protein
MSMLNHNLVGRNREPFVQIKIILVDEMQRLGYQIGPKTGGGGTLEAEAWNYQYTDAERTEVLFYSFDNTTNPQREYQGKLTIRLPPNQAEGLFRRIDNILKQISPERQTTK